VLATVAPARWPELVRARRDFCAVNLSFDCRELLHFVDEAPAMLAALGYADVDDFLTRGLELQPKMVAWALTGLQRLQPDQPIPYREAVRLGRRGGDRRSAGAKKNQGYNVTLKRGNRQAYYLARLDRDRPELAAQVRAGELKAYAAARLAGIVKTKTPLEHLRHWWSKASETDRRTFQAEIAQ
jgi:hypothetical protein